MFTSYANLLSLLSAPDTDPTSLLNAAMEFSAESAEVPELASAIGPDAGKKLIEALEISGAHGMSDAFIELGTLYRAGGTWRSRLIERHIDNALDAFRRADTLGHRDGSIMVVETIYHSGRTDLASEAWARLRSITDQDPGQTGALFMQGLLTQEGFGVSRNLEAAMEYFREAADRNDADAAFQLALHFLTGECGVVRNDDLGIRWLQRAAELGSVRAMHNFGAFYGLGDRGLPRDPEQSLNWYLKAASSTPVPHGEASFSAGVMLLRGDVGHPQPLAANAHLWAAVRVLGEDVVQDRLDRMDLIWIPLRPSTAVE
ncbi:sel1 repeat family protein [Tsukamurella asaccharolytica]|uniref:Sel1 repeat family protein n=1 Tax=Tsukamurella asaccharolytica TaxID=2592067 RepID=A0A5C5RAL2_9ACTN|nr:tetratricopeptide repeat protein [Tsukamurella asaccharolytica]TWS19135.1 sel1 repeat family protein [Tsukamurella asaccharolytica]